MLVVKRDGANGGSRMTSALIGPEARIERHDAREVQHGRQCQQAVGVRYGASHCLQCAKTLQDLSEMPPLCQYQDPLSRRAVSGEKRRWKDVYGVGSVSQTMGPNLGAEFRLQGIYSRWLAL